MRRDQGQTLQESRVVEIINFPWNLLPCKSKAEGEVMGSRPNFLIKKIINYPHAFFSSFIILQVVAS